MLYGNESISHYSRSNIAIWMAMAFQAGAINIGAFMACHRFVSHVTGFATHFGFEMAAAEFSQALGMLVVPLFFLFGSMISGQLVDIRLKRRQRPRYYVAFGLLFVLNGAVLLLGVSGTFGQFGEPLSLSRDYALLIVLCLTCGIQNGTVTTVSRSVIRTTHLTGITTDLGIGLVRLLNRRDLPEDWRQEFHASLTRFGLIFFFGLGSVVGGLVFRPFEYLGFLIPTVISGGLFSLMLYFQIRPSARADRR